MNKVIMIGNAVRDAEEAKTDSGKSVAKVTIAVQRNYTNAKGEREADFFDCIFWEKRAELAGEYIKKGNKIGIEGRLNTREYEDKNGEKRYKTEITVDNVEFLTPKTQDPKENKKEKLPF